MAIELNIAGDFATILDGWEPITVMRRGSAEAIPVPRAWRFAARSEPAETGIADVARHDITWQFPWNDVIDQPRIGDKIIDAADACWTILSVIEHAAKSRLRCIARNLYLVHQIDSRIDIQAAIWEDSGSGPEIVGWTLLQSAVPARIQADRVSVDHATTPPTSTAKYRVILGEQIALDHNHRVIGPDGTVYQILEFTQADRIDTLPVATVIKQVVES